MKAERADRMLKRKQRHSTFLVMNAAWKLPGTTDHQMPARAGQKAVRQRLNQAEFLRKFNFFDDATI